jgi:hypothetical protein
MIIFGVGNDNLDWNVYKHIDTDYVVEAVSAGSSEFTLTLTKNLTDIAAGDVIGLHSFSNGSEKFDLEAFYAVISVDKNVITVATSVAQTEIPRCTGSITRFLKVRAADISSANTIMQESLTPNDYIWIDSISGAGQWSVLKNENLFTRKIKIN